MKNNSQDYWTCPSDVYKSQYHGQDYSHYTWESQKDLQHKDITTYEDNSYVMVGADRTRAYFWPAVNKSPTRLWSGYFLTQPEDIFYPKGKVFRGNFPNTNLNHRWLTRPDLSHKKLTRPGSKIFDLDPSLADSVEELTNKVHSICKSHVKFLKKMGMVVLKLKWGYFDREAFKIDDVKVKTITSMKVLWLIFQTYLKWKLHVDHIISKIKPKLTMLRKISRKIELEDFLKVTADQLYSVLYFASPLWLNINLADVSLWTKIKALHYKILCTGIRDF